MWLLLVALCLAPGLENAIPGDEAFYNPERFMNISQKILLHGYPSEEHEVMTEDGYFLSLSRIPYGRGDAGLSGLRTPVLIVHGFCLEGGDWVDNFPDSSLAFILADAGYDVWIGNNRGNSWSRWHRNLSIGSEEFWDFSFHEMAMYDLPAMVDFILAQTEQEKLFYVGHAQGSSLGFIAFSSLPQLAEKIKLFFALAPVYTFHHVQGPVLKLAFLPDLVLKVQEVFVGGYCQNPGTFGNSRPPCIVTVERKLFFCIAAIRQNEVFYYTSVKNLLHWGQTAKTGEFKQFDYGLRNLEKYKRLRPPFYQIEAMRVPVAVWSGGQDWVTPPVETQRLLSRLTNIIHHEHFPDWNHFDHHWGLNAPQRLYRQMVTLMEENL
uniref:Lipase n=1 Tax=Cyanoderma ruficeps TaxID=181631 RepID=A0A8C3QYV1_9PASS